jgi:hypothetical protein
LVLGSSSERQEKAIMAASGLGFRVAGIPEGPAPLRWYANPDRIYIFCSDASRLSALARLVEKRALTNGSSGVSNMDGPITMAAAPAPAPQVQSAPAAANVTPPQPASPAPQGRGGLLKPREPAAAPSVQPAAAPAPVANQPPPTQSDQVRGTMNLDQFISAPGQPPLSPAGRGPSPADGGSILGNLAPDVGASPAPGGAAPQAPTTAHPHKFAARGSYKAPVWHRRSRSRNQPVRLPSPFSRRRRWRLRRRLAIILPCFQRTNLRSS